MNTPPIDRFHDALAHMPESGGGGCHTAILGACNHGVVAGLSDGEILNAVRGAVHGKRRVPDGEITKAIGRARQDVSATPQRTNTRRRTYTPPAPRKMIDGQKLMQKFRDQAAAKWGTYSDAELWELSPVRLSGPPEDDAQLLLETLYKPDDILFIGSRFDTQVKTVSAWLDDQQLTSFPHIIPNSLTGEQGQTKSGTPSFRADDCVKDFRFAVVEFDGLSRQDQIAFWLSADLPVSVLIDSGGKSIHGWVRADAPDRATWESEIEGKLFNYLTAVGADPACRNEARLSRLPGHMRSEKKRWQRILYLSPEGVPPCRL